MKKRNKTDGLFNFMDLRQPKYIAAYSIIFAILVLLSVICLFPIIWYMLLGFKEVKEMHAIPASFFPKTIDLSRIHKVWSSVNLTNYFMNTVILIVGCWASSIVFNGMSGYFLSKIKSKGYKIFNIIIFWTILMPGVSVVPLYCWLADVPFLHINLLGNRIPIMLMAGASAFDIMLYRNFFNTIPTEYMEAAKIDGCSATKIFFSIMLPLSKPIIAVTSISIILGTWQNFFWPYLILGNTDKQPLAVFVYGLSRTPNMLENDAVLITALTLIPPFCIYALLSKHIMGGINMSGIKG